MIDCLREDIRCPTPLTNDKASKARLDALIIAI